jgi:hypothetical protein
MLPTTQSTTTNAAVHRSYVDGGFVPVAGGTMTGKLTVPTFELEANANLSLDGNSYPTLTFDSTDYLIYNRTTNTLSAYVAGAARLAVDSTGIGIKGSLYSGYGTLVTSGTDQRINHTADGWSEV